VRGVRVAVECYAIGVDKQTEMELGWKNKNIVFFVVSPGTRDMLDRVIGLFDIHGHQ